MINIGQYNDLRISRFVDFGAFLIDGQTGDEVLLPSNSLPRDAKVDDELKVFIYTDSEDRVIATTQKPLAVVGDFVFLTVKDVNSYGAFLDWGLSKDLFVPFAHQPFSFDEGDRVFVYIKFDESSERVIATGKTRAYLNKDTSKLKEGDQYQAIVYDRHDLGYKVLIDDQYEAMLFKSDLKGESLSREDELGVFIKQVRSDGKVDVTLFPQQHFVQDDLEELILAKLEAGNGLITLNAKSTSEEVLAELGVSRKLFKKALGALYKNKKIEFTEEGTRLL